MLALSSTIPVIGWAIFIPTFVAITLFSIKNVTGLWDSKECFPDILESMLKSFENEKKYLEEYFCKEFE